MRVGISLPGPKARRPLQMYSELLTTSTISQDYALGQRAEEDSNFASFGQRLSSHLSEVENENQHSERPPPANTDVAALDIGGLENYQMQLMLLEQQNKKRLLLARQEQAKLEEGIPAGSMQEESKQVPLEAPILQAPVNFLAPVTQMDPSGQRQAMDALLRSSSHPEVPKDAQGTSRKKRKELAEPSPEGVTSRKSVSELVRNLISESQKLMH